MPKVVIDGQALEFEGQHYLLQFAKDKNIEIPYFCYHPSMSIPTNCRMCLVEVGNHARDRQSGELQFDEKGNPVVMWGRKPITACNTMLADGMHVRTHKSSEEIRDVQKGVLEYLLVNHPLDCPICDQAGECPLQIWTYKYGPEGSRFENLKVHKRKHVDLGPRVILDEERCINCTRCVRFTEEISKSDQLSIIGRGDKNYPGTPPGTSFDEAYSMNTIDLCPVGALTSKDNRFKSRVWEMNYSPAIDMNDSTGTNVFVWIRDNEVIRITPRHNAGVNDYWIPDAHRLNTDYYNKDRVSGIRVKGVEVDFDDGMAHAAKMTKEQGKGFFFLGSAYASLESNFALRELATASAHTGPIYYVPHIEQGAGDGWLIQDDRTPNATACDWLGFEAIDAEELKNKMAAGEIPFLYALENDRFFGMLGAEDIKGKVIAHGVTMQAIYEKVDVLLPAACSIEADGTFVNYKGIPQMNLLARQVVQMTPEEWMRVPKSRLDKGGVANDRWRDVDNIFDVMPSWKLLMRVFRSGGDEAPYAHHRELFASMQEQFEALESIEFSYKPPVHAFKSTQLEFAPQW